MISEKLRGGPTAYFNGFDNRKKKMLIKNTATLHALNPTIMLQKDYYLVMKLYEVKALQVYSTLAAKEMLTYYVRQIISNCGRYSRSIYKLSAVLIEYYPWKK